MVEVNNTVSSTSVVVVDDELLFVSLLVEFLGRSGFNARGVHGSTDSDLLAKLADLRPDVVLLDEELGSELGTSLRFIAPAIELGALVIMLSSTADRVLHARCVEEGAAGVMSKRSTPAELAAAIGDVVAGRSLLSPSQRTELIVDLRRARSKDEERKAPFAALTEREEQVLIAICDGESAADIASAWQVSVATVRSHIRSVLIKLGAGSQLEAAAMARRVGWPWPAPAGDGHVATADRVTS